MPDPGSRAGWSFPSTGAPLIGSSGVLSSRSWSSCRRGRAWIALGSWLVLQVVYASGEGVSDTGPVAYPAHIVGFVAGIPLALPLKPGTPPPPEPRGPPFDRRARPGW